jgi:hypothetical protein
MRGGCLEGWQRLKLCNGVDVAADQTLNLPAVRAVQHREADYIKWLQ